MPIRSGVLSFGLVAIPVKVHSAVKDETIRFNFLHEKCGSRVRNRYYCPVCNEVVERDDQARGYQTSKDQYVMFTDAELDSLEAAANRSIELKEFVPLNKVDPIYFESSYYLAPDEGGEKPYRLLAIAMAKTGRAAVAELVSRGKEQIVIIRPYQNGLMLHGMYYQNEIRDFSQIPRADSATVGQLELDLGEGLIERLTVDDFDPEEFRDEYRLRVQSMLDEKSKGKEVSITVPPVRHGQIIDLMDALKQSMERVPPRKKAAAGQKRRRKAS
jgi:DNA end-binding protein Ku